MTTYIDVIRCYYSMLTSSSSMSSASTFSASNLCWVPVCLRLMHQDLCSTAVIKPSHASTWEACKHAAGVCVCVCVCVCVHVDKCVHVCVCYRSQRFVGAYPDPALIETLLHKAVAMSEQWAMPDSCRHSEGGNSLIYSEERTVVGHANANIIRRWELGPDLCKESCIIYGKDSLGHNYEQ